MLDKKLDELRGQSTRRRPPTSGPTLDNYIVNEKAYVAPTDSEESSSFFSERMDAENCGGEPPGVQERLARCSA